MSLATLPIISSLADTLGAICRPFGAVGWSNTRVGVVEVCSVVVAVAIFSLLLSFKALPAKKAPTAIAATAANLVVLLQLFLFSALLIFKIDCLIPAISFLMPISSFCARASTC